MKENNWNLHDLVLVAHQPEMQNVQIKGLIAVITEIDGDHATIAELQLSGRVEGGTGVVEFSCLEKPKKLSAPMRAAYAVYKQNVLLDCSFEEKNKNRKKSVRIIAQNNSIEPKILHKMLKDLDALGAIEYYGR